MKKLDREILKTDYGVSYGSVTLKSLQNDNVPELDLLVREAIQNSSDASLKEDGRMYMVNFIPGIFNPACFNELLDGLQTILDKKYPGPIAEYLEIRDTKTSGLTGKIKKAEIGKNDHGNFFKLIYDTGKRQTISTAGGNWGFGKSVYYRVGIGIVIFYSRIKNNDSYENRLIITLVEDESKADSEGNDITLLNSLEPRSAGKAWWGIRDGEDLLPLTDMTLIKPILDIFGIIPFKNDETGTSIIIPYINTDDLLTGIIPVDAEIEQGVKETFLSSWAASLSDYLRLSIQKWYAPKIHNQELEKIPGCSNKWLLVAVDNKPIRRQDLLPFFRLTQELYTTALAKTFQVEYKSTQFPQIVTLAVNMQSYFDHGTTAGYVAMIKLSKSELNGDQSLLSPYDYIGKFEADGGLNEPILMYARDPGMVIDYAITGPWVKNLTPPESSDEYLFAFFVPNTNKTIKQNLAVPEYAGMMLGEYLRECEASDHMEWNDPAKMQIVQRIQKNSINQINKTIKASAAATVDATPSKLSNRLGRSLLPKIGYGKQKGPGGSGSGGGGGGKITNVTFDILSQQICENEIVIDFSLKLNHQKKSATVFVLIASEAGWIDAVSWNDEIGTDFPVEILECKIREIKTSLSDEPKLINGMCSKNNRMIDRDEITVELLSENEKDILTKLDFKTHVQNPEVVGQIRLYSYDKKYRFIFGIE